MKFSPVYVYVLPFIVSSKYSQPIFSKTSVFGFPTAWETKFHMHEENNKCIVLYTLISARLDNRDVMMDDSERNCSKDSQNSISS